MATITVAHGLRSGNTYSVSDITIPVRYAEMTLEPLIDDGEVPLAAVRRKDAPHFRRLGSGTPVRELRTTQRSVRHNQLIKDLHFALSLRGRDRSIFTNVFKGDGARDKSEQTLFYLPAGADFRWYKESSCRFEDFTRIQTDLAGRDMSCMAPSAGKPAIIIEVIDTHFPEPDTFAKLMELSRAAHQVYFYILDTFELVHAQYFNRFTNKEVEPFRMRITWALLNGELVRNGVVQALSSTDPRVRAAEARNLLRTKVEESLEK